MIEKQTDAMSSWASGHGLRFTEEGQLPPATGLLRKGTGVGEHRSSLRVYGGGRRLTETSWRQKRKERASHNLCEGRLPGGLSGTVAHHVYLTDRGRGLAEGEDRYLASVATVVFAELGARSRASFNLTLGRPGDVKTGVTIGRKEGIPDDPLESVMSIPTGRHEVAGFELRTWPAEPEDRMSALAGPAVASALSSLPEETRVECESGRLCVYIQGDAVSDPARLDDLCRFASALAEAIDETVSATPALHVDQPLGDGPETAYSGWVERGAGLVDWDTPPPSVIAAQQAYRPLIKKNASRSGWSTFGIATVALIVITLLAAAGWFAVNWIFGTTVIGVIGAAVILFVGMRSAGRAGLEVGEDVMKDRTESTALPWGLEAFAREYAKSSGLTREDPDELRRRLPVPVPGRAQMAWQGELGDGVPGHLAVWIDPVTDPLAPRFWLIAVVEGPVKLKAPDRYANIDGFGIGGAQVDNAGRTARALDDLRERVCASAKSRPAVTTSADRDAGGRPQWAET